MSLTSGLPAGPLPVLDTPLEYEVRHCSKRLEVAAIDLTGTIEEIASGIGCLAVRVRRLRNEARITAFAA